MDVIVKIWDMYKPEWSDQTYRILFIAALALLAVLMCLSVYKRWSTVRVLAGYLLCVYLVVVFASTVFTRYVYPKPNYRLELFWSYKWGIARNRTAMLREIILNCCMLMPFGFLFPVALGRRETGGRGLAGGWRLGLITILGGLICTVSIEVLQLVMRRGLFEFDDMIHNTVGTLIGYLLYCLMTSVNGIVQKRNMDPEIYETWPDRL